jgi:hypothetical protein
VFTNNQISQIKYIYYINNISKDSITPQEHQLGQRKSRTPSQRILVHLHLLSSRFAQQGKIARLSTLMVGTQQV